MKNFFVICPLGFESHVCEEIRQSWTLLIAKDGSMNRSPVPALTIDKGGVAFTAEDFLAYQLNFFLKTASRILLRLAEFRVRDFPKLHEKVRVLPWREYFSAQPTDFEIAAAKSRLNHEGRILQTLQKTLAEILPQGNSGSGKVYVRIHEDVCTISLDTTGEHLHKRGWATLKGEAPLRETIAAYVLRCLAQGESDLRQITVCDPMMGSGTFLLEARALFFPQWHRPFAFQKFKSCPKIFLTSAFVFNYKLPPSQHFKKWMGSDKSPEMVAAAQKNWESLEEQIHKYEKKNFQSAEVVWSVQDVFGLETSLMPEQKLWIVSNPPYGERLQDEASGQIAEYVAALAKTKAEKIALLYPQKYRLMPGKCPVGYKIAHEIPIVNGGLRVFLTILHHVA